MIVADKPAESWTDEDVTGLKFSAEYRWAVQNPEALQKNWLPPLVKGDARRITTVTRQMVKEVHQTIWFDKTSDRNGVFI